MELTAEHAEVAAARDGDAAAFARLYHRYARMVHGILLARVPRDAVDDLVQDVFLTVYQRLDSLRDPAAFGGWLAMIARNRATDHHRRTRETEGLDEGMAVTHDAGELVSLCDKIRLVERGRVIARGSPRDVLPAGQ